MDELRFDGRTVVVTGGCRGVGRGIAQRFADAGAQIGKALARCDWFLVVLSPSSVKSQWVKRELLYALNDGRYQGRIIPVSFKRCNHLNLSWTLGGLQFVDFMNGFDEGCLSLLRIWGIGYDEGSN